MIVNIFNPPAKIPLSSLYIYSFIEIQNPFMINEAVRKITDWENKIESSIRIKIDLA